MKRLIIVLSVLVFLLGAFALVTVSATEQTVYSGTCGAQGDNLVWTLDTTTGQLVISGEGEMADYAEWAQNKKFIKNVSIGNGVTSICGSAFYNCGNLISISIPDSLTSIGMGAFKDCESMTGVYITDLAAWCNIVFRDNPLYYANNLYLNGDLVTDLVIPESVTSISANAFKSCTNLTSVEIHDGVTSVGENVFEYCENLKFTEYENAKYLGNKDNPYMCLYGLDNYLAETALIHPDARLICGRAFVSRELVSIDIPDKITSIGDSAFAGCSSLTSIDIPDSVISIGKEAFRSAGLTKVTIGSGVTSIGEYAFYGCSNLDELHIKNLAAWCAINFESANANPIGEAKNFYLNGEIIKDFVIPDDITSISKYAFANFNSLTSLTIGKGVKRIGKHAFINCESLKIIEMPNSITDVESDVFAGGRSIEKVIFYCGTQDEWEKYKFFINSDYKLEFHRYRAHVENGVETYICTECGAIQEEETETTPLAQTEIAEYDEINSGCASYLGSNVNVILIALGSLAFVMRKNNKKKNQF
ncbi:MAG: leucine-rich repeat domain-containing protein [Clostridia bacterium]|nr:leucine-rich repeat domain-containing protein [Clostridia bacterium]